MGFDAVLFDLDGTLLNTIEDLADATNAVLARFGFPTHPVDPYYYFVGDGAEMLIRRALPEGRCDSGTVRECVSRMREEYAKCWDRKTLPYEGVSGLLDALTGRGVRMAILSNKPDDFTKPMVARLLPDWPFEQVVGALPGVPRKPDPTAALGIAEAMRLAPAGFLYLGDTGTDMKTANGAGMHAVGALWGFREAEELLDNGAKELAEKPEDVLELL